MAWRNILAGSGLLAFSAWYAWLANALPERSLPNTPGPSFFPIVIVSLVALLSAAMLVSGIAALRDDDTTPSEPAGRPIAAGMVAAFLVYLAALPFAGFIVASVVFFAVLMGLYGARNPLLITGGSLIIPFILYAVFRHGFQIVLPTGIFGF